MTDLQQVTQDTEATELETTPKHVTITAENPDAATLKELCSTIKANYNFDVNVKDSKFNFKKSKDKDTGIETTRESLILALPYPSVEGVITILNTGGKQLELLMDAVEKVIEAQARDIISDGPEGLAMNAGNFPVDKVSWEFIANMPKVARRGGGIPKEVWDDFATDYLEVMPTATGKTVEQIATASKILQSKLVGVKTNAPVLELLVGQLAIYADTSENIEEYMPCVEFLLDRAETYLNVSPEELLANL